MWIVCLADSSHEMPSFIFSENKKKMWLTTDHEISGLKPTGGQIVISICFSLHSVFYYYLLVVLI